MLAAYALQIAHGYYAAVVLHLAGLHLPNGVVKHQFGGIDIYIHSHFFIYIAEESRCQAQFAFIIAVGENFPCQIEVYGIVYALTFYCYHRFAFLNRENGRGKQFYIFLFGQFSRCYRCRFYYLVALLQIGCADIYPKTLITLVNVTFDSGGIHYVDRQFQQRHEVFAGFEFKVEGEVVGTKLFGTFGAFAHQCRQCLCQNVLQCGHHMHKVVTTFYCTIEKVGSKCYALWHAVVFSIYLQRLQTQTFALGIHKGKILHQ